MNETVADAFTTGVDWVINAAVLVALVGIMTLSTKASQAINEQQVINDELRMYREYNQYDNTIVYPQDVVSAVYRYRGIPVVRVSSSKGNYQWTETTSPCPWTTVAISSLIDQTKMYDAVIVWGLNGEVAAYEFKARP